MERIQEALDKARSERHNVSNHGATAPSIKHFSKSERKGAIKVEYTNTRQIKIDDEELKKRHIVAGFAHDVRSEPYRQLRSQVLQKMRANSWRSLAITSPNNGSGKTLTAINLAISLSQDVNQTVVLVDLDLRSPSICKTLDLGEIEYGVVDYLQGTTSLQDILINPGFNRLVVLPSTPQGAHSSEILSSPEMQMLHQELLQRYEDRIIIYDLPALLKSDDALVFSPFADATLLVVDDGGASKSELERSLELLRNTQLLGTVLNKVR